jgi:hypothetical protein
MSDKHAPAKFSDRICMHMTLWCMSCLQLVSGQAVGTLFDLEESRYMQERMEAEAQHQGTQPALHIRTCSIQ